MKKGLYAWIARRVAFSDTRLFSSFVVRLSLVATAISVCVMVLAVALLLGFKQTVTQKVFSFWGHLRVESVFPTGGEVAYAEDAGMREDGQVRTLLQDDKRVDFFAAYAQKYGILVSPYSLEGVLCKGYEGKDFSAKYFDKFLLRGRWLAPLKDDRPALEIVLSQTQARLLKTDTGESVVVHFIQADRSRRARKLQVVGIYKTGIEIYDKNLTFIPLSLVRVLNSWRTDRIGGYEVFLKNRKAMNGVADKLVEELPDSWDVRTTADIFPSIFAWLELLDMNQYIIIIIMFVVAIMNLITCMITLVMDRMPMTGILKTMGASSWNVRKIFLYHASFIALAGIILGDIFALVLGALQNHFGFITLQEQSYFVEQVRLIFQPLPILLLNIVVFVLCFMVLILPSYIIHRQSIVRTLRFN